MLKISQKITDILNEIIINPFSLFSENDLRLKLTKMITKEHDYLHAKSEYSYKSIGYNVNSNSSKCDMVIIDSRSKKLVAIIELKVFFRSSANELFKRIEKDRQKLCRNFNGNTPERHIIALHLGRTDICKSTYQETKELMKQSKVNFHYGFANTRQLMRTANLTQQAETQNDLSLQLYSALKEAKESGLIFNSENDVVQTLYNAITEKEPTLKTYAEWPLKLSNPENLPRVPQMRFDLATANEKRMKFDGNNEVIIGIFTHIIEVKFNQSKAPAIFFQEIDNDITKLTHPDIPPCFQKIVVAVNKGPKLTIQQLNYLKEHANAKSICLLVC